MPFPHPSDDNTDRRVIADLLQECPVGSIIDYDDMSKVIGAPILHRRYLIYAAMKIANAESGAIFGVINTVGYKRLAQEDAHVVGHKTRRRVRRASRAASKIIVRAIEVANDLPPIAKLKAYAEVNTLGLIGYLSRDRVVKSAPKETKPLPVGVTMRAMMEQM